MATRPRLFIAASGKKWTSAGGLVLDRKGRVALIRENRRGGSRWTLPKGRLEPGETLEDAALREVREEAGVRAHITAYLGLAEGKRSFVHYFVMRLVAVKRPRDPNVTEVRFCRPASAMSLVATVRDRRILDLLHVELAGRASGKRIASAR